MKTQSRVQTARGGGRVFGSMPASLEGRTERLDGGIEQVRDARWKDTLLPSLARLISVCWESGLMDPLRVYLGSLASALVEFVGVCYCVSLCCISGNCNHATLFEKERKYYQFRRKGKLGTRGLSWWNFVCVCAVTFPVAATAPPFSKTKEKADCPAKGCFA